MKWLPLVALLLTLMAGVGVEADTNSYAVREMASMDLLEFEGGDGEVWIVAPCGCVVLLILLLVLL